MPSGPRPASRSGAGPGRGKPRARTGSHALPKDHRSPGTPGTAPTTPQESQDSAVVLRRSSVTSRAIALAVVFLVLTISFASSLRVYFSQTQEIASTRQEISDHQRRIADLNTELARWNDPAYVQTRARVRLGWVMPGETGYRVVDERDRLANAGPRIGLQQTTAHDAWWEKLWGSVETADRPAPAKTEPTKVPTITVSTKPAR